jgi:hypothetical protein
VRAIRDLIIQPANPSSISARLRARRWQELLRRFPDLSSMRVLDLGGTPQFWRAAPQRPVHVTVVNITPNLAADEPWIEVVVADACRVQLAAKGHDVVVSNSLLEHVVPATRRRMLADVIHSAADRYWIQTPNRYFPIEPHWLFPGFQFLPFTARVLVTQTWPFGHRHSRNRRRAAELVGEVELIGGGEMRRLFPDAEIWVERFLGLPKSLVAIRS